MICVRMTVSTIFPQTAVNTISSCNRPRNTDLRGLKVEIGHNRVIHTLDRDPNLVAKGQIGGTIN